MSCEAVSTDFGLETAGRERRGVQLEMCEVVCDSDRDGPVTVLR